MAAETAELAKRQVRSELDILIPASVTDGMEVIEGPQGMALVTNDHVLHARFQPELTDAEIPKGAPGVEEAKNVIQGASEIKRRRRSLAWAGVLASPIAIAAPASGSGNEKSVESMASVLPRSTEDRPDDLAGRQIHVVYAVPSDGGSLNSDTDGSINQILANVDNYAENRGTASMRWRWDLYQGQPDITRFQFNNTGAELSQMAKQPYALLDYFNSEIKKAGLNNNPQKVYMGIYESPVPIAGCNNGEVWPATFIGGPAAQANSTLNYLKKGSGCIGGMTPHITSALLHIIGFPSEDAPNSNKRGNIVDNIQDVLWKDSWKADWPYSSSMFDPGHDVYLMTGRRDDVTRVNYVTWPLNITENNRENGNVIYLPAGVASAAAAPLKPDPGNRFPGGDEITLKAEGQFVRWGDDCAQETDDTCELLMDRPHNVTAFFKETIKKAKAVRVAIKKKLGGGVVTGSGIKCPPDCEGSIQKDKELALTAKPKRISKAEWIGGCARKIGNRCIVTYGATDAPKTATVVFSRK